MDDKMRNFLNRLVNDAAFRAQAENEPVKAFNTAGIAVKPGDVQSPASLPSNDEIRALLALDKHWDYAKGCQSPSHICKWPKP
jgi:hypothetical protein